MCALYSSQQHWNVFDAYLIVERIPQEKKDLVPMFLKLVRAGRY